MVDFLVKLESLTLYCFIIFSSWKEAPFETIQTYDPRITVWQSKYLAIGKKKKRVGLICLQYDNTTLRSLFTQPDPPSFFTFPGRYTKCIPWTCCIRHQEVVDEAAKSSDTDEDAMFHYVSYVPVSGYIWELDGLKRGPGRIGKLKRALHAIYINAFHKLGLFSRTDQKHPILITSTIGG
jgi:hypothetical protein